MSYRLDSVCLAALAVYACCCWAWALTTWPVALLWRSLTALLLVLVLVWPILVHLLHALAATKPTGPRGRAYAAWMVAHHVTTGPILPRLLNLLGIGITSGSVVLGGLALGNVHPLLVPLAFVPLALRDALCTWVMQHLTASIPLEGEC